MAKVKEKSYKTWLHLGSWIAEIKYKGKWEIIGYYTTRPEAMEAIENDGRI